MLKTHVILSHLVFLHPAILLATPAIWPPGGSPIGDVKALNLSTQNNLQSPTSKPPLYSPSNSSQSKVSLLRSLISPNYQFSRPSITFLEPSCHMEYSTIYEEECSMVQVRECGPTKGGSDLQKVLVDLQQQGYPILLY
jgi:hypothetical protein